MNSFGNLKNQNQPSKKQINAMLKKAAPDLNLEREKYLNHVALNKAIQMTNKETVRK